jgi:AH receptor-interacting protein
MLSFERPEEYEKESWQMNAEEKAGSIPQLKEEGNELFKAKEIEKAAKKYTQALGLLEQLMLREKPNDEEWLKLRDAKLPLLLNLAQCKLSNGEFYPVIEHCTEVLEAQPGKDYSYM